MEIPYFPSGGSLANGESEVKQITESLAPQDDQTDLPKSATIYITIRNIWIKLCCTNHVKAHYRELTRAKARIPLERIRILQESSP